MSSQNSIQQQLAARRAKLQQQRQQQQQEQQPQLQSDPTPSQPALTSIDNSMDVDDTASNHAHSPLNAAQNTDVAPERIDRDFEIALQLQRQFDQESNQEENIPQRQQPFSSSTSFSFSSAGPDGHVRTYRSSSMPGSNAFPAEFQPFFAGMQNDPFFRQSSMPSAFESPFFMQNHPHRNTNHFNIMMNNFNGAGNFPMGLPDLAALLQSRHQRPVATQSNIDNNTVTETFHAPKQTSSEPKCEIVDLTHEEEKDKETEEQESDGHTCAICMEPFKEGDKLRRLPCMHAFHAHEIDRWLKTGNDKCPICRVPISGQVQQ